MLEVRISKKAKKQLLTINEPILSQIKTLLEEFAMSFFPKGFDIVKLQGYTDVYRIRLGKYRLIYKVDFNQHAIYIGEISLRKDAYK